VTRRAVKCGVTGDAEEGSSGGLSKLRVGDNNKKRGLANSVVKRWEKGAGYNLLG